MMIRANIPSISIVAILAIVISTIFQLTQSKISIKNDNDSSWAHKRTGRDSLNCGKYVERFPKNEWDDSFELKHYPSSVTLTIRGGETCSGVLIDQHHIITVGQCIKWIRKGYRPRSGSKNKDKSLILVSRFGIKESNEVIARIHSSEQKTCLHMNYVDKYNDSHPNYDFGLLKSEKPFKFNEDSQPVCTKGVISNPSSYSELKGLNSNLGKVISLSGEECSTEATIQTIEPTEQRICARHLSKPTRILYCKEDIGSGVYFHFEGRQYLIGLVSIVTQDCEQEPKDTIYTGIACEMDMDELISKMFKNCQWMA